ncbi:TPA: class I SAM-dependent methyltransferase [Legionella pneumophila]|nr:methyltransferase domain-containing protein [Legionella pneumophila]HAT8258079.1 methyltransferase domain-containing protein [Legionella pneumophila]HAT8261225.1 methyltransferase domain-containing protein [Legionella pneumophila]HAT8270575.1 methyltransferase domain-containing protein [Legionella pneumophila]HAT8271754.1 methyltransferase domain-containing protein [Legionella pneumophila]
MNKFPQSFSEANERIGNAIHHVCLNALDAKFIKSNIQESYQSWANVLYDRVFLNWGLCDKKIYRELSSLNFDFSTVGFFPHVYGQSLLFYLIRPLIKIHFFNKRLLDVGCGNGVGLKISSELLKTRYALGIDLVNKLVTNSNNNFYIEDKINYMQADAENMAIANESFDIVTNLESSHLYPQIEHFFSEVERVLAPNGFFCYADVNFDVKRQAERFETFVKTRKNLRIIEKHNITKMIQASIYQRLIVNEKGFYQLAQYLLGPDKINYTSELANVASSMGLMFLPWWRIRFKNPALQALGKFARRCKHWNKKYYFYYLIQKIDS